MNLVFENVDGQEVQGFEFEDQLSAIEEITIKAHNANSDITFWIEQVSFYTSGISASVVNHDFTVTFVDNPCVGTLTAPSSTIGPFEVELGTSVIVDISGFDNGECEFEFELFDAADLIPIADSDTFTIVLSGITETDTWANYKATFFADGYRKTAAYLE